MEINEHTLVSVQTPRKRSAVSSLNVVVPHRASGTKRMIGINDEVDLSEKSSFIYGEVVH